MNTNDNNNLLTPQQAADYLGITLYALYYLKRTRKLTCYKINGKLRFRPDDMDVYLDKCRIPAVE